MRGPKFNSYKRSVADLGEGPGEHGRTDVPFILVEKHIKLFPQRENICFSRFQVYVTANPT